MASPQQAGRRCDDGRIEETVRRAKLHLSTAPDMLDCAASAVYRARELAGERDGAGDELAEAIVAVRSSARMLVDVLSELRVAGLCPERTSRPHIAAPAVTGSGGTFPAGTGLGSMPGAGKQTGAAVFLHANSRLGRHDMTNPETPRRVEIKHDDQTVAAADVTASAHGDRTARASLHRNSGHTPPGSRASLVDAVLKLPEVQASERLEATVPLGDGESLQRLRERTDATETRPAGSTVLVDANMPPDHDPGPGRGTPSP